MSEPIRFGVPPNQPSDEELLAWAPKQAEPRAEEMRLAGYSDFRLIAQGGEGTIYRARQNGLDRHVAIKVINVDDPARLARFRRELDITVRLGRQHPHIVTVLDTGTAPDGLPCIVMEFYDLGSLHDRLRERGPLPVEEVVAAGTAVADALAFAHGQGFLHRDVKPQNILVLPTSYVLADFGIARLADAGHSASLELVSYRHAAPQMIDGAEPSAADDLWSLGSTLFTLLDGAPPFASDNPDDDTVISIRPPPGGTLLSYLGRVRSAEPRPLRRSDVPPELAAVIARCLTKPREDRYPDASSLRAALAAVDTAPFGWTPPLAPQVALPADVTSGATTPGAGSELAGLTVRLPDERTAVPDFGPRPEEYPVPVVPPREVESTASTSAVEVEPRRTGRRRRRLVMFALIAVLIGAAAGITATVLSGLNRQGGTAGGPTSGSATAQEQPVSPAPTSAGMPEGGDPAFAPSLRRLEDNGTNIVLFWSDPTGGKAQFVVVDVTGAKPEPLITVAAGTTTHTVDGLDPAADQYCFQVLAIGLDDPANQRGASARTCAVRNR